MAAIDIALGYIARGWNPVPIPYRSKGPNNDGWQTRIITAETAPRYFNGDTANIGILLGPTSQGLTDVDLDCAEAIAIAPYILPKTGAIFGRASRRASHWLYYTDLALTAERASVRYIDPKSKDATLVELRTGGAKGAQTVFPGSIHKEGETITWDEAGEPADVDGDELRRCVRTIAAYATLAKYWPKTNGSRHERALALGGFLSRAGMKMPDIKTATEAIAKAANDEEWSDRRKAAEDAATAHLKGDRAYGLNKMRELFGADIADKVAEWLDYGGEDALPFVEGPATDPAQYIAEGDEAPPLIQSSKQFTENYVPPDYLIDGLLQKRFAYSLTGQYGAGKTSVALLVAAHVGLGRSLGDHDVEQGRVLIFAGENPDDIRARWIAISQQMQFDIETIDVHFIPGTFKISALFNRIRQEIEQGGEVALIIVDTSAAYYESDDENDNVQQGKHARRLRSLTTLPGGPCVLVNCHPAKNATNDNLVPRGGGAFTAELDGNLTAIRDDMSVELHWQIKFRGPDFAPIGFMLRQVTHERLKDTKGRLVTTVVASILSDTGREELIKIARGDENLLLKAISESAGAGITELAKALGWYTGKGNPHKSKVHRAIGRLKRFKLISQEREGFALTDKGKKVLR